jgi:hypothetical protein
MTIDFLREELPEHDGGEARSLLMSHYEPPPRWLDLTVIAQDPTVRLDGEIVRSSVRVPAEHFEPGPRGHRFHVVDYDATHPQPVAIHALATDKTTQDDYCEGSGDQLLTDATFRAQNVFAVAARTLDIFESALGRRIPWSGQAHQLFLVPAAFREANAFYDPDAQAIFFGYFDDQEGGLHYTSFSHDIVAHETTHAILDGLRSRFIEPGLPDQAAFHEAFADIVALLSAFSLRNVIEKLIGGTAVGDLIPAENVTAGELRLSSFLGIGNELGTVLGQNYSGLQRGEALRRSVELEPSPTLLQDPNYEEPHRRGEILVAAVTQTFVRMWTDRLTALRGGGTEISRSRAAEEGAKAADHLLRMVIRAIDYCPPLEFAFEDFLDAIIVSDQEVAPDDEHGYRDALRAGFGAFGISQPAGRIIEVGQPGQQLRYSSLHVEELRTSRDEVYRFIWDNADVLGVDVSYFLEVDRVRPSARVGPDGFVLREIVATYIQRLDGTVAELSRLAERMGGTLLVPPGLEDEPDTELTMFGGGALIFDQWGRAKWHQTKPIFDWLRQGDRLGYLFRNELRGRGRGLGASLNIPAGQQFAIFHEPAVDLQERW